MKSVTSGGCRVRRGGFTVAELVAVIAAAALIGLILLPAIGHARQQAQAVACQTTLSGFGQSMQIYANDNEDGIPGVNTSGVAVEAKKMLMYGTPEILSPRTLPVQNWDWMTPLLQDDPNLPDNHAARFHYLYSEYRCPEQRYSAQVYRNSMTPDKPEFQQYTWPASSYLMPAFFQWFGQNDAYPGGPGQPLVLGWVEHPTAHVPILAKASPTYFEVRVDDYSPRLDRVGPPARKIFAADGVRYIDALGLIDVDASVVSTYYGAFGSGGAWWSGDVAYGVLNGSQNWCGQLVSRGNPALGRNLPLSYRHRPVTEPPPTALPEVVVSGGTAQVGPVSEVACEPHSVQDGTAQNNRGFMNAVFFDGHVERMNDRQSREIDLWYPTGGIVQTPPEGMTCTQVGMVIP